MSHHSRSPQPQARLLRASKPRGWIPHASPLETCFHGGEFFDAIGDDFTALERRHGIINADVLDAWFPPAPGAIRAIQEHLEWMIRTSPPTQGEGLTCAIAGARGIPEATVAIGGGSSDLIFRAFLAWLRPDSRVLLLDPTYGEYAHVLENVIGCRVERFRLRRADHYALDPAALRAALGRAYDLVVLVNPNSPTGRHVERSELAAALEATPPGTRVWIDEAYIDYVGGDQSLEALAAIDERFVVCKSMSKVYALSGLRAAYCCATPAIASDLRRRTPPWVVSLPAQVAAVKALEDFAYFAGRYRETHVLREAVSAHLRMLGGIEVFPGVANFVLCHLAEDRPTAAALVAACRERGLFIRDAGSMSPSLGERAIRIAVKDAVTNRRMVALIAEALAAPR